MLLTGVGLYVVLNVLALSLVHNIITRFSCCVNGADDVSIRQDDSPSNGAAIRQVDSPMVRLSSTPDDVSIRQDNSPIVLLRLFLVKSSNRSINQW
jgi:hypothetical protein